MPEIVRHKKTGGLYEVLFRGATVETNGPLGDNAGALVFQRKADGAIVVGPPNAPKRPHLDVLYGARIQASAPLVEGAEAVVYRSLNGDACTWVRRASEMDDGRFEPAGAPTPDPSTPGEVERMVDALIDAVQNNVWRLLGPQQANGSRRPCSEIDTARTALLSHISTAARAEGAGDLARDRDGRPADYAPGDAVQKHTGDYQISGINRGAVLTGAGLWRYVVEHKAEGGGSFLHIYAAANLRSAATNPQDQE